jgi:hypothetical protein
MKVYGGYADFALGGFNKFYTLDTLDELLKDFEDEHGI